MPFDYTVAIPLIWICSLGILVLIAEFSFRKTKAVGYWATLVGLAVIGILLFPGIDPGVRNRGGRRPLAAVLLGLHRGRHPDRGVLPRLPSPQRG